MTDIAPGFSSRLALMLWQPLFSEIQFFSFNRPLLCRKQSAFQLQNVPGLWRLHWQLGKAIVLSTFYTRIDQVCILWGVTSGIIFFTAQFSPLDWGIQALLWSVLTLVATVKMVQLSRKWATIEPMNQVIHAWAILILAGLGLTDGSIFLGWGQILMVLCPLWLGLSAIGYFYTGVQMRSRTFFLVAAVHLLGIALLPYVGVWQFLATGIVMGASMLLLAEFQWDSDGPCATETGFIEQPE